MFACNKLDTTQCKVLRQYCEPALSSNQILVPVVHGQYTVGKADDPEKSVASGRGEVVHTEHVVCEGKH